MSVAGYYNKLKGLWDEMQSISPIPQCTCQGCTCRVVTKFAAVREKEKLYDFLMALDEVFGTIKTQILNTKPTPGLGSSYHLVVEDEQQKQVSVARRSAMEVIVFQL
ncbi:hypothetical protein Patl1_05719 [Pistacia atlantica]|uniref:Uncharacterized protein n=1 Tax=Pistacia atlantica TaxID=434234 RepID=A0ACC1BT05_9ROSI|nr:hypothetical protein Patl1_05719 [Pistacia atlantica]